MSPHPIMDARHLVPLPAQHAGRNDHAKPKGTRTHKSWLSQQPWAEQEGLCPSYLTSPLSAEKQASTGCSPSAAGGICVFLHWCLSSITWKLELLEQEVTGWQQPQQQDCASEPSSLGTATLVSRHGFCRVVNNPANAASYLCLPRDDSSWGSMA